MASSLELRGELVPNLAALADVAPLLVSGAATLMQRAERIMNLSRRLAPVRNVRGGTLRSSATVAEPQYSGSSVTVVMGYGGAASRYALTAHENPRTGKTGGVSPRGKRYRSWAETGQWKFLEQPYLAEINGTFEALRESTMVAIRERLAR